MCYDLVGLVLWLMMNTASAGNILANPTTKRVVVERERRQCMCHNNGSEYERSAREMSRRGGGVSEGIMPSSSVTTMDGFTIIKF